MLKESIFKRLDDYHDYGNVVFLKKCSWRGTFAEEVLL